MENLNEFYSATFKLNCINEEAKEEYNKSFSTI